VQEHGGVLLDGIQVASTLQCPHCGAHFVSIPGSGKRRAWCTRCRAVTCGELPCDQCVPIEARLDHAEGRKTRYDETIHQLELEGAVLL
jgi:hypothetical protein